TTSANNSPSPCSKSTPTPTAPPTPTPTQPHPAPTAGAPAGASPAPTSPCPPAASPPATGKSSCAAPATAARPVGPSFSPLDDRLQLTPEGYPPAVLRKVVRQGGKISFAEASADLRALCELEVSPTHVQRLTERVGREWAALRDREVAAFRAGR